MGVALAKKAVGIIKGMQSSTYRVHTAMSPTYSWFLSRLIASLESSDREQHASMTSNIRDWSER
jgi:hypothetical protein